MTGTASCAVWLTVVSNNRKKTRPKSTNVVIKPEKKRKTLIELPWTSVLHIFYSNKKKKSQKWTKKIHQVDGWNLQTVNQQVKIVKQNKPFDLADFESC